MQEKHLNPEEKFSAQRVNGMIYIIDNSTGKKVSLHGKVFKTKVTWIAAEKIYTLQEGYKVWLGIQDKGE